MFICSLFSVSQMESDTSLRDKGGNLDVVVEIHAEEKENDSGKNQENELFPNDDTSLQMKMNLFNTTSSSQQPAPSNQSQAQTKIESQPFIPSPSSRPPVGPSLHQRRPTKSAYAKPKSRILEPAYPNSSTTSDHNTQTAPAKSPLTASPNMASPSPAKANSGTPRLSAPITPKTPLMMAGEEDDDEDDDNDVYSAERLKPAKVKRGKKVKAMVILEWIAFTSIMAVLISSKTVSKFKRTHIWSLELWKWCVLVLVIFCGRLLTQWLTNVVVFLIEKNFLLKKKVLYFVFGMKKSFRVVIWLASILVAWALLINRVKRKEETSKVLNKITRGIVSTLVGAILWMLKTLLVKLVASSFHVKTYFDRIQESIFHQYILQALSGDLMDNGSVGQLSFKKMRMGKEGKKGEVINVDKLYKIKREKVSAWTMGGLIRVIRNSELPTMSEVLDEEESGEQRVITNEVEARDTANQIFKKVAKHGHR